MNYLETPYDEETEFIECTVCNKSIRGDSLFKIHLTTPGHIKKEDALVAAGQALRRHAIPVFEDIKQYLDYMKLEEPIIGLNYLEEVPCQDPQAGPRYTCKLCYHVAHLPEMVHHVIGRKHRQKYMEMKRPDLVTWDKQNINQGGKIIKARAEMIERQDGRGSPVPMAKKGNVGKLNISPVPRWQNQCRDRNISPSFTKCDPISQIPPLMDFDQVRYPSREQNMPPVLADMLNRDRRIHQEEDALSCDPLVEEPRRRDFKERDSHRQEYMDLDYRRECEEDYVDDTKRRAGDVSRCNSRVEMPLGQARHEEYYPEEAPPYRRPYPERDVLKEFCSEGTTRGQVCSAQYQSSQPLYREGDNHRWSLDRESGRHDGMKTAGRQGSSEPESERRSFLLPMENEKGSERVVHITNYGLGVRNPPQEDTVAKPGPSRGGSFNSQRQVEVTRSISDIPEPFRRFLKGPASDGRRRSRFSDATAEEVETAKEMFSDEFGPRNSKVGRYSRPNNAAVSPEIHGIQRPDLYTESQGPHHTTESYQRGFSEPEGVFDMLKNVEIENAEEAGFLKDKLCDLLKEFKAKKSEKAGQNRHSRPVTVKEYNNLWPESDLTPRHQYETILREDSDLRRPEGLYFQENHRERVWKQDEHMPEKRLQEYYYPGSEESRQPKSNISHFEDKPSRYPERFQEPMHPRDHRPPTEDFLDSHSSAPPLHVERGSRWDRGPRYSRNLDKITSTLLELVKRK